MQVDNPPSITHYELSALAEAAKGSISHLYLHWTAGRYQQFFDDYHFNIDDQGKVYCTCNNLLEKKAHTWRRNSRAVGITLCCGLGAVYGNKVQFGDYPPTKAQIISLGWVTAILATVLQLDINYPTVATHGEIAMCDGYGPGSNDPQMRWDLLWLPDFDSDNGLRQGGNLVRLLARQFSQKLKGVKQEILLPLVTENE